MKVAQLLDSLDSQRSEQQISVNLGDIQINDNATSLRVYDDEYVIDEMAENALANYLGVSRTYLAKCPGDLKAMNFRYWLDYRDNAVAMLETMNGNITGIHRPDAMLLPTKDLYRIVSKVFRPEDDVRDLRRDEDRLHLDVTTQNHHITVPNPDGIVGRPDVGDITAGGVRILAHPNEAKAPSVQTFLYRLVCRNGQTTPEREGTIRLKGHTVPEVLVELELAAQRVLAGLDEKLASYAEMANRRVPGNPTSFVYQISREYGIGKRILDRLIERANLLPQNATLYDVQQLFTEVANSGVSYDAMLKLQTVGGDMAFTTERVLHRCNSCERLLPE